MNNLTLLQQIRGSMRNPEPLSEENFCKVAEPGLTFAEAKKPARQQALTSARSLWISSGPSAISTMPIMRAGSISP